MKEPYGYVALDLQLHSHDLMWVIAFLVEREEGDQELPAMHNVNTATSLPNDAYIINYIHRMKKTTPPPFFFFLIWVHSSEKNKSVCFHFQAFFLLKAGLGCDSSGIFLPISRSLHLLCTFSFSVLLEELLLVFYISTPASLNTFPLLHLFLSITVLWKLLT